ncbi:MAG: hypothetical protein HY821_05705 [Acidobacteria bacterium]|nr:hypothetical protein [Acidobacteriota bacterium]
MADRIGRLAVAGMLVLSAGCGAHIGNGPHKRLMVGATERHTQIVAKSKAAGAEQVRAEISMAAGELKVSGGAHEMMEAEFTTNLAEYNPEVRFDESGFRRKLTVEQRDGTTQIIGDLVNRWDVKLAGDLPLDLSVKCGAGESRLDLRELTLRSVEMNIGVGEVKADLRNNPKHDYDVAIRGGVGQATVIVPTEVGVVAEAAGGIGEINVRGMKRDGNRWVNEAYGKSKVTIRLNVKGGIGQIDIRAE